MPGPVNKTFGKRGATSKKASPEPRPTKPADKREQDRTPAFKNGRVILSDHSVVECIARNISDKGCLISAVGAENLPDMLIVYVDAISEPRHAKVIWRDKGEAGLEFLTEP